MEVRTSADELVRIVADRERLEAIKTNPIANLEELKAEAKGEFGPAYIDDKDLVPRGGSSSSTHSRQSAAIGSIILVLGGKTTPEVLVALGSAAIGAWSASSHPLLPPRPLPQRSHCSAVFGLSPSAASI